MLPPLEKYLDTIRGFRVESKPSLPASFYMLVAIYPQINKDTVPELIEAIVNYQNVSPAELIKLNAADAFDQYYCERKGYYVFNNKLVDRFVRQHITTSLTSLLFTDKHYGQNSFVIYDIMSELRKRPFLEVITISLKNQLWLVSQKSELPISDILTVTY